MSNKTFVHNGGGYDCETFIFQQLFSAGIEPNPGPYGVILSATDGEGNATSTCEGGSSRSAPTAPSNIVQRKRSRSSIAAVAEEREIQRTMDDEQGRKVQSARLLAEENRMWTATARHENRNAGIEVIFFQGYITNILC
jgi:hypothetical protein